MTMTKETHPGGVPDPRDELIRKTVDFATHLQERIDTRTVDLLVAASQCKALWFVTAGLVDEETSGLLAQQADILGGGRRPIKRFFAGKGKLLILAYLPDGAGYVLRSVSTEDGSQSNLKSSVSEVGFREAEIAKLVDGLLATGFTEL